jgi:hypothetical protein
MLLEGVQCVHVVMGCRTAVGMHHVRPRLGEAGFLHSAVRWGACREDRLNSVCISWAERVA